MTGLYKLTKEQFNYIVDQCDSVLEKHKSDISVVGIAWLHVLNSHPANQLKYVFVFNKRKFVKCTTHFIIRIFKIILNLFISMISSFVQTPAHKKIVGDIDILFISHLVSTKSTNKEIDFYYQELPEYMHTRGYRSAVALMNHTGRNNAWKDAVDRSTTDTVKFLIPRRLGFLQEMTLLGKLIRTSFYFLKKSFSESNKIKKSFFVELSANVMSEDTINAFRVYETVVSVLKTTNVKVISVTWEGHSFERLVCHAVKTAYKKKICIAYHHTILFPSSHALKRSIGQEYDPDVILTVGSVTKKIIESKGNINAMIKEYGSPRLKNKKSYHPNELLNNGCLVAPEGLTDESIRLFTFGITVAESMPELLFIFRTHPTVRFDTLQRINKGLQHLPSNVVVSSNKNIDDDFARSSWIIYRSSSVALFATLAGLRPVYLQMENELSIDPLYTLKSWRLNVSNSEEMKMIIEGDRRTTKTEKELERKQALVFCENYMMPYQPHIFEESMIEKMSI